MNKSLEKNADTLKTPDASGDALGSDNAPITASGVLSGPDISFDNKEDYRRWLDTFITQYIVNVPEWQTHLPSMALRFNEGLPEPFSQDEYDQQYKETVAYTLRNVEYIRTGQPIPPATTLTFAELMSQEFPKARYAIEPFFESGTVNMVSAPPNTWKSWLLFYFSVHISQGTKPFGKFETEKSKVMIVNEEDSYRSVQDRFKMLGITDSSMEMYFRIAQGSKLETKFIDDLLKELQEKGIKTVIFDSLRAMHNADENDSTAMQTILDHMKKISRAGITVIFIHHNRKKSPFDRGSTAESTRGSSAINAAISGHISLDEKSRDDKLYLVVSHLKSKAGEKIQPFELEIVKDDATQILDFVYQGEVKSENKKLTQAKDAVIAFLQEGGWKTVKELEILEVGSSTLRQALALLTKEAVITQITRKEAIKKLIPVSSAGRPNEKYYSMNTEMAEEMVEMEQDSFTSF